MFNGVGYRRRGMVRPVQYPGLSDLSCAGGCGCQGDTSGASPFPEWAIYAALIIGGLLFLKKR
jgi:hypothetical protein